MDQNMLNFIRLLDLDAYAHAVDAWLDKDPLILVSRNGERIQKNFRRCLRFNLRNIVPFGRLGCEIGQAER